MPCVNQRLDKLNGDLPTGGRGFGSGIETSNFHGKKVSIFCLFVEDSFICSSECVKVINCDIQASHIWIVDK